MSFFSGLARAFTVPKSIRAKLDANPLAPLVKGVIANELGAAINAVVEKNVPAELQDAAKNELVALVNNSGLLK